MPKKKSLLIQIMLLQLGFNSNECWHAQSSFLQTLTMSVGCGIIISQSQCKE